MNPVQRLQSLILPEPERRAALEAIAPGVCPEHYQWISGMAEFLPELLSLLEQKNMSIGKLRKLLFGARTEKLKGARAGRGQATPPQEKAQGPWAQIPP